MSLDICPGNTMHRRDKKVLLKDLNSLLICTLCNGYFVEATTFDCMHTFCRSCIIKHFETTKQQTCPTCDKKKGTFKPDPIIQSLVYKMVPGLFTKETQRREDFYRSSIRASSTCSEDSLLGDLRHDHKLDNGDQIYFSPEDPISLSLEFYQSHLDDTDVRDMSNRRLSSVTKRHRSSSRKKSRDKKDDQIEDAEKCEAKMKGDRRYLQCPAAVSMCHLQKFLRMKYALSAEHRVDIIYEGEVLPVSYTLMDVAYTFNWSKLKPMRFFYRIFTPLKVQPIKIINTPTSNGGKHLQIVPVRPNSDLVAAEKSKEQFAAHLKLQSRHKLNSSTTTTTSTSASSNLPNVTRTGGTTTLPNSHLDEDNCIFEYEEPDKEEIKRFAESRDREWARMRYEDDGVTPHHVKKRKKNKHSKGDVKKPKIHAEITSSDVTQQESIKLKVKLTPAHMHNGHGHSHKHKHRSSSQDQPQTQPAQNNQLVQKTPTSMSTQTEPKKIVQSIKKLDDVLVKMGDPKLQQKLAAESSKKEESQREKAVANVRDHKERERLEEQKSFLKTFPVNANQKSPTAKVPQAPKPTTSSLEQKKPLNTYSNQTKKMTPGTSLSQQQQQKMATVQLQNIKSPQVQKGLELGKMPSKITHNQSHNSRAPIQQKTQQQNHQIQRTAISSQSQNLKSPASQSLSPKQISQSPKSALQQSQAPKSHQNARPGLQATQGPKPSNLHQSHHSKPANPSSHSSKTMGQNQIQQKILNPTTKPSESKRVTFSTQDSKPHILNSQQYSSGFTVSKIEQGQKRKAELESNQSSTEKRPCLEITLINPPQEAPKPKRPPPATIPLDRIKKTLTKPKLSEGMALDLSKKLDSSKFNNGITTLNGIKNINGMKFPSTTAATPTTDKNAASNLQMLSTVALQHSKQTNSNGNSTTAPGPASSPSPTSTSNSTSNTSASMPNKPLNKPQIPNLQTIRIPNLNPTNNHRNIPKLTEINKANLKMIQNNNLKNNINNNNNGGSNNNSNGNNNQIRSHNNNNMVRSIPNPAMLVRQLNQSRMNSTTHNSTSNQNNNQGENNNPKKDTAQHINQSQPKILNPLAKQNTEVLSNSNSKSGSGSSGNGGTAAGSRINSLMSKILDHNNKNQMIASSTTTIGTAT